MGDILLALLGTIGVVILFILLLPVAAAIASPFLLLISKAETKLKDDTTPMYARKQQEVLDAHIHILSTNHNLRNECIWDIQDSQNCSRAKAEMIMLEHDCEDMGIKMNRAYAAALTHYDKEIDEEIAQNLKKKKAATPEWKSEPLPGHEGKTLTFAEAQAAAQNNTQRSK